MEQNTTLAEGYITRGGLMTVIYRVCTACGLRRHPDAHSCDRCNS